MAKRLRKWLQKRLNKSKIFYPEDYGFVDGDSGGGGGDIPGNAMLWDDGSAMLWDDGSYMTWD